MHKIIGQFMETITRSILEKTTVMSEIINPQSHQRKGVTQSKKLSTRVDLTPMVDLGFLLITFFIFTTTLNQPKTMRLSMPADSQDSSKAKDTETISFILKGDNKIICYNGNDIQNIYTINYSSALRNIIQQKQKDVALLSGDKSKTIVLIKPTRDASYKNIVDILDEMQINNVERYVLMDASKTELEYLSYHQQ